MTASGRTSSRWVIPLNVSSTTRAEGCSFCVDMNPLGDRALAEIDGFSIDPKAGEMRFRARWKGALEEFLVTSDRDADRQIFGFIADLERSRALEVDAAHDKIELKLRDGRLEGCYITRFGGVTPRSVRLVMDDQKLYLVIPSPRERVELKHARVEEGQLKAEKTDGTEFRTPISLPGEVEGLVSKLMNSSN